MNPSPLIPVIPATLGGQSVQLVDARLLHTFLEVRRDFSNWIKRRIHDYGFIEGEDFLTALDLPSRYTEYSPDLANIRRGRGKPRSEYWLTLDMAKELAMVERTPRGQQARRYFIACERELRQRQTAPRAAPMPTPLSRAERQAINRQAWAEASGEIYAAFHRRREALTTQYQQPRPRTDGPVYLPPGFRPTWAQ